MMNEQLKQLYQNLWAGFVGNVYTPLINTENAPAYPFLLCASEKYEHAHTRVMIVGQETNCWGGKEYPGPELPTVEGLMEVYDRFVNTEHGYSSPYWQFINSLQDRYPEIGFVVNNINKIGKEEGVGCDEVVYQQASRFFPCVRKEIEILRPDLIVFLSGPAYDRKIGEQLGPFAEECIPGGACQSRLLFGDTAMPQALRFYHPKYLRMANLEESVKQLICSAIESL